jgi:hypothetical protein
VSLRKKKKGKSAKIRQNPPNPPKSAKNAKVSKLLRKLRNFLGVHFEVGLYFCKENKKRKQQSLKKLK